MTSQYTYFQSPAAVGGTVGLHQHRPQQQSSYVWNGSQWTSTVSSQYNSYAARQGGVGAPVPAPTPTPLPPNQENDEGLDPAALVKKYSESYHYWRSMAQEQKRIAEALPEGDPDKAEAARKAAWAEYYADESARAAHRYREEERTASSTKRAASPPPSRARISPSAVSPAGSVSPVRQGRASRWGSNQSSLDRKKDATDDAGTPDGLQRYVHKCLERCTTDDERRAVQTAVEGVISKVIASGKQNSTDWDAMELVPIPPRVVKPSLSPLSSPNHESPRESVRRPPSPSRPSSLHEPLSKKVKVRNSENESNGKRNVLRSVSSSSTQGERDFLPLSTPAKNDKKRKKGSSVGGFVRSSAVLQQRATRFSGRGGIKDVQHASSRTTECIDRYCGKSLIGGDGRQLDETDYEQMTVRGTCQVLEKDYLRLTAPPRPELVRPLPVLERHLKNLKKLWKSRFTTQPVREYTWFCSQFKAVRQDLTVQRLDNAFSVAVYETHARIALEEGDLNEYNQCQTQLQYLYEQLRTATQTTGGRTGLENECEFISYRIIYYVFLTMNKKYEGGSSDLFRIMLSLSPQHHQDPCIKHALSVRVAVTESNYHRFFRLLRTCPRMGAHLMNHMVPSMRHLALQRIQKAYRPSVAVSFTLQELGFDEDDKDGKVYLRSCGCKLDKTGMNFMTKESVITEATKKQSSLI